MDAVTCHQFLVETSRQAKRIVTQDEADYSAMETRLALSGILVNDIRNQYQMLVAAYAKNQHLIESPFCDGYYLRGTLLHARTLADIRLSTRMLVDTPLNLNFHAARMGWFAHKIQQGAHEYPNSDVRAGAYAELARFDEGVPVARHFTYDRASGAVKAIPLQRAVIDEMQALRLNVSFDEVDGYRFNNGRAFQFFEHPWFMVWSAQQIARQVTGETLIAYDDPSVRQFFPYFAQKGTKLTRTPNAADFLSVKAGQFILRELKFSQASSKVDVAHALNQLRWTVSMLNLQHPKMKIVVCEIVVPRRGEWKAGDVVPTEHVIHTAHGDVRVHMRMLPDPP